jgi:4-alpha-glucanotransferase
LICNTTGEYQKYVSEALRVLGKERVALVIHDQSFPSISDHDTGRGTPYSRGGADFIRFTKELGFNVIQLGPQGQTTRTNQSPYEGTIFSKNILSIALDSLAYDTNKWAGILSENTFNEIVTSRPHHNNRNRVQYQYIYDAQRKALDEAYANFRAKRRQLESGTLSGQDEKIIRALTREFEIFKRDNDRWLDKDAVYEALSGEHGNDDWRTWESNPIDQCLFGNDHYERRLLEKRVQEIADKHSDTVELYKFSQFIVHEQHRELREHAKRLGIKLYGDRQVGFSPRDEWKYQSLFLKGYRMGAPPSRTNLEGQPWNYRVLDPDQYFDREWGSPGNGGRLPGPVLKLINAWLDKMFAEFDGLRIDHPHGLVCPWVYQPDYGDQYSAVQHGARLFSSPHLADHPGLKQYTIVAESELNPDPNIPRYAEDSVATLTADQVNRYSVIVDAIMGSAKKHGCKVSDILFEVLSTLPVPLQKVMEKYGIGRFRVTQKADPDNPKDVYRSANAWPEDWIMVGTHDTEPIWRRVEEWRGTDRIKRHADYLAERLIPDADPREAFSRKLATRPEKFVQAMFADIFASPARNIMIFFADLFGMKEVYNRPGSVNDSNWTLRVSNDYEQDYRDKLRSDKAINIPHALAMAIRSKGQAFVARHNDLVRKLEGLAQAFKEGS